VSKITFDEQRFQKLMSSYEGRVLMLNLLKFKPVPEGEEGTGAEAYARYGSAVIKLIEERGGKVLWSGRPEAVMIGSEYDEWDAVAIVEDPSPRSLFDMAASLEDQQVHKHREAGLERTVLIACKSAIFPGN
jgi:uncharacterized protein (DUF1330 family)